MTTCRRIALLTGTELQHQYVARALAELPSVIAIIVTQQPRPSILKRSWRMSKRFGLRGMFSRVLLKGILRATGETSKRKDDLARVLGGSPGFPDNIPILRTIGVNSVQTQALLRQLAPDVLCVYGTYIVSDATLSLARDLALNLHTGLSPRYRGADCEFWPLYEQEPGFLGATVHTCTSDVDGGAIFGTAAAKLEPGDHLGAVFGRCVIAGAALYKRVVNDLSAGRDILATPQDLSIGREYKVAMRGWAAELRVASLIRRGLIRDFCSK
jgi:methionyl-tRNA formyltransferase